MKLNYFAIAAEITLIVFLLVYIFVLTPKQPTPSQSSTLNISSVSLNGSSGIQGEISSAQDVVNDLSALGCREG